MITFQVGLHGLYSKYRRYTTPLAAFISLIGCCYVRIESQGENKKDMSHLFGKVTNLFEAWIVPLMEDQRQEAAAWIQQFAESSKVLCPWSPNDVNCAEIMVSNGIRKFERDKEIIFLSCLAIGIFHDNYFLGQKCSLRKNSSISHLGTLWKTICLAGHQRFCLEPFAQTVASFTLVRINTDSRRPRSFCHHFGHFQSNLPRIHWQDFCQVFV